MEGMFKRPLKSCLHDIHVQSVKLLQSNGFEVLNPAILVPHGSPFGCCHKKCESQLIRSTDIFKVGQIRWDRGKLGAKVIRKEQWVGQKIGHGNHPGMTELAKQLAKQLKVYSSCILCLNQYMVHPCLFKQHILQVERNFTVIKSRIHSLPSTPFCLLFLTPL